MKTAVSHGRGNSAKARVPGYCLHKASGQARVVIDGKQVYLGRHGSPESWEKYHRRIAERFGPRALAKSIEVREAYESRDGLTVVELASEYHAWAETYYVNAGKPSGHLHQVKRAVRVLRELYGRTPAAEFGPLKLKAIQRHLIEKDRARTYINSLCGEIRRLFRWGASEQLVPVAVYDGLRTVDGLKRGRSAARETEPIGPIADAVVEATMPWLPATIADMVKLQRLTGMRPDEVCRLRPCDIDRSGEVWSFCLAQHKTAHHGRRRVVFIGPRGQDILRPHLLRDAASFCFVPAEVVAKVRADRHSRRKTPLSCGNRPGTNRIRRKAKRTPGDQYNVGSYRRAIHRACDLADLAAHKADPSIAADVRIVPRWSPNRLRHTTATEIRKRFGLEAAQVTLGHAHARITETYAERDLSKAAAVMAEVG